MGTITLPTRGPLLARLNLLRPELTETPTMSTETPTTLRLSIRVHIEQAMETSSNDERLKHLLFALEQTAVARHVAGESSALNETASSLRMAISLHGGHLRQRMQHVRLAFGHIIKAS